MANSAELKEHFKFPEVAKPVLTTQEIPEGFENIVSTFDDADVAFLTQTNDGGFVVSEFRMRTLSQANRMEDATTAPTVKDVDLQANYF